MSTIAGLAVAPCLGISRAGARIADPGNEGSAFRFPLRGAPPIQDTTKRVRVNRQIRISPIRVIGADGSQLGILEVDRALAMAQEAGLDLVEVAPMARPPTSTA